MKTPITLLLLFIILSGTSNALNPSRTYKTSPEKLDMKYNALKVKTNDGEAELNSWYFPAKTKTTHLVLIAHNGEGNMGDYLRRVNQFLPTSNVLIFDYRGFGESSDFEIDKNMYLYPHFQDDLETMIDHCRKQHTQTFDLYGFGMGGGLVLGIGYGRTEIRKIIADTPFLSIEDLEERFESWEEPMEVPFAGYDKNHEPTLAVTGAPGKNLKGVKLIVGSSDLLYSAEDYKALQKSSPKLIEKEIHVVENPDRKDNFSVDEKTYSNVLLEFLKE